MLGTAQDGGLPQAGCRCARCEAARARPSRRRRVASLGLVGATGRTLLVDATPDVASQLDDLAREAGRPPGPPDEVALTHAHAGHFVGLWAFGRESMHASRLRLRCSGRMASFLLANRPWAHLLEREELALEVFEPGRAFPFDGLRVTPFAVPHRAEDTDTVGYEVEGPSRRLVYLPDADALAGDAAARVRAADLALVDGTFHSPGEVPGRDLRLVPHPFVRDSLWALSGCRGEVRFTHLNHTNPLEDAESAERAALPAGFAVAEERAVHPL